MNSVPNELQQKCFKKYNCMDVGASYRDADSVKVYLFPDDMELWQLKVTLPAYLAIKLRDKLNRWYEDFHETPRPPVVCVTSWHPQPCKAKA